MARCAYDVQMPDLGMGDEPITVSVWLVDVGQRVIEGDRLVEVLAGNATVDLPAPVSGVLGKKLVGLDERVYPGQVLGRILQDEA